MGVSIIHFYPYNSPVKFSKNNPSIEIPQDVNVFSANIPVQEIFLAGIYLICRQDLNRLSQGAIDTISQEEKFSIIRSLCQLQA